MNKDMLRLMVQNAQATLQTVLMVLDDESTETSAPAPAPTSEDGCTHPESERLSAPVMGAPRRFICRVCGEVVKEV